MPRVLRSVGHEDRLSIVDHLDELRGRLIVIAVSLVVAFVVCFVGNNTLLNLLNAPLKSVPKATQANHIGSLAGDSARAARDLESAAAALQQLARSSSFTGPNAALIAATAGRLQDAGRALPQSTPATIPITIGVGEPFTITLTVCFYAALLLTLPILLYQVYAFVMPALTPAEKRAVTPILVAAPALFVMGVVFTYLLVLPAAVRFLQGYNNNHFQNLVQAQPLYSFEVLTMAAIGLAFQMPLGLLGLQRAGLINGSTLTRHWRYATVIIAVLAAAMPGADPVTTALETAPLVILFLISVVLLKMIDRRDAKRALEELTRVGDDDDRPDGGPLDAV